MPFAPARAPFRARAARTATRLAFGLLAAGLLCALGAGPARAQDRGPAGPAAGGAPSFEELKRAFGDDGVLLTYRELLELLGPRPVEPKPTARDESPTGYVLLGAQLTGRAGERLARLEATFDIEVVQADGWVVVPLGLAGAALEAAQVTSPGGPANAIVGPIGELSDRLQGGRDALPKTGFGVLLPGGARRVQVTARIAAPVTSVPGRASLALELPGAALTRVDVTVERAGPRFEIGGALAFEEGAREGTARQVRAFFAPGADASWTWDVLPPEGAGSLGGAGERREPLLIAQTETAVKVDEGVLLTTCRIQYRILQAPCAVFTVRIPKSAKLVGVRGDGLAGFPTPEETAEGQLVHVRLRTPARERYALEVSLQQVLGEVGGVVSVPRVETLGTERESGLVAARGSDYLELEPARSDQLSQLGAAQLTAELARELGWRDGQDRPPLVFRYLRQPFALALRTRRVEAEVDGRVHTLAVVRDDEVALATTVRYTVRKRGVFGVRLQLPRDYQLLEFGEGAPVKDHRFLSAQEAGLAAQGGEDAGEVLAVDFAREMPPGTFHLTVFGLVRRPSQPEQGARPLDLPQLRLLDVVKESGVIAVGARTHLELALEGRDRLWPVATRELPGLGFPFGVNRGEELTFGFQYTRPSPETELGARFRVTKREPKVSARTETFVDAQEDQVRVEVRVRYDVEYAGIESVRVEVPAALASEGALKVDRDAIKDRRVELVPGEPGPEGPRAVWTFALQGKRTGSFELVLAYSLQLDGFNAGQRRDVTLHAIRPLDCAADAGFIALKSHENLVVSDVSKLLVERRDHRDLPDPLRREGVLHGYRALGFPHRLTVRLTRYDFQAPEGLLIRHLHQDALVTREGTLEVEAFLAVENATEQYLRIVLPKGARFAGLKVDGRTEMRRDGDPTADGRTSIQVHLGEVTKAHRGEPFQVRVRYDLPEAGHLSAAGTLEFPGLSFPRSAPTPTGAAGAAAEASEEARGAAGSTGAAEGGAREVPIARATRSVYLPEGYAYLGTSGRAVAHFDEDAPFAGLRAPLADWVSGRSARERRNQARQAAQALVEALNRLKTLAATSEVGMYPELELPRGTQPLLFEDPLGRAADLGVSYAGWGLFYALDLLCLLAVLGLGVLLERKGRLRAAVYAPLAAAAMVLLAALAGSPLAHVLAGGFVGAVALGGYAGLRAVWRELSAGRAERREEAAARSAQVARVRARAAEAEAALAGAPADGAPSGADTRPGSGAPTDGRAHGRDGSAS